MLNSIHIGTVVANADYTDDKRGQYLGRVLVKIPGLTVIDKNIKTYKSAGSNVGGNLDEGLIKQVENSEKVWAYVLAPITGESAMAKYNRTKDFSTLSDSADVSRMYENSTYSTVPATQFSAQSFDGHTEGPAVNMHAKVNSYGNNYVTSNYSDSGKGMFALPAVNSKVLIGFINGARGLPIVLGKVNAGSEMEQIYGAGEAYPDYPNIFENTRTATTTPPTDSTAVVGTPTVGECGPVTTANARSKVQSANNLQVQIDNALSQIQSPELGAEGKLTLSRRIDSLTAQRQKLVDCITSLEGQSDTSVANTGTSVYSPVRISVLGELK